MSLSSEIPVPWELLDTYARRYRVEIETEAGLRLERSIARRSVRAHALRRRIAVLGDELEAARRDLQTVEDEIEGSWRAAHLFVEDQIDVIRERFGETWSPMPVLGFRIWAIRGNGVFGYRTQWRSPQIVSTCLNGAPGDDIPHAWAECGPPACGTYATKDLARLRNEVGIHEADRYVAGVVALAGKVVEHEHGYRAARVEVVAATATVGSRYLDSTDLDQISSLFRDPEGTVADEGSDGPSNLERGDRFLEHWKERQGQWTWEMRFG